MATKSGGAQARRQRVNAIVQAQARKSRQWHLAIGATVTVVVVIIAMLVAYRVSHRDTTDEATRGLGGQVAPSVLKAVTSVPAHAFAAVGAGGTEKNAPVPISGPALRADGKPRVLYVGGEFCPICAAERWAVIASLSRFGTFENLSAMASTPHDSFPDTQTFSFHGSSYSSPYLVFDPYEVSDRNGRPLERLPRADQALRNRLHANGVPFIDVGGKYALNWAQYSPGALAGMTRKQIADELSNPNSSVAREVLGAANVFTARVCSADGNKPASVCTAPGVVAAARAVHLQHQ